MRKITYRFLYVVLLASLLIGLSGFSQIEGNLFQGGQTEVRITQVDTSQFPKVTVYVSVTDASGEPVPVSPSQLVVKENGETMTIEEVSAEGDIGPLTTMLVMDVSGSMNHARKLPAAKNAAKTYVNQTRPGDMIGLLAFHTELEYTQPITKNRQAVLEAIENLKALEDTAMYDALELAIQYLEAVSGRKAIIVLTDGLDNRSKISPQEVIQKIGPEGLSISAIGLGVADQSTSALSSLDEGALRAMAEQAGGAYAYAEDAESLQAIYERYGRALQSEYAVSYTSPSTLRDGVNRALTVSLSDGEGGEIVSAPEPKTGEYNPGGLVPEVANPSSWGLFIAIIAGLALLLLIPILIMLFRGRRNGANASTAKGRVKLLD
jgi:VWFA-related protein